MSWRSSDLSVVLVAPGPAGSEWRNRRQNSSRSFVMRFTSTRLAAALAGVALLAAASTAAWAKPAANSNWHVGVYNRSGQAFSNASATATDSGLASVHFTTTPDTALLTTSQGSQK